ncbi:hypothetical protein BS47DRAFT_1344910 [Hydnum rufescens UP504]|uniref:SET domain-containing protein n=1 Tax=Hydnum rufescens UP504 TaxID=1448309 RepID=A0A9P6AVZ6_9AGAM|nr:hypothetical protein BS47DRAFT_1344910 [Hydnum rufescens UP504]
MAENVISPSEDDLTNAARSLRISYPTLGAPRLLSLLLEANSNWTVSEKRLRKVLQKAGLSASSNTITPSVSNNDGDASSHEYPTSRMVEHLTPSKWTNSVKVADFGREKGKGLVATKLVAEGERIWVEDPFVMCPEWELEELQRGAHACMYCTRPISLSITPPMPCKCSAMFCNRLCHARGAPAHAFLCPAQNPAAVPFLEHVRKEQWKAPYAWALFVALILSHAVKGVDSTNKELYDMLEVLRGLAALSLEKRVRVLANWQAGDASSRALWKRTHTLFVQALYKPADPVYAKKLQKLKGKSIALPPGVEDELFGYDQFLVGLGKMSLNMEAHGGLNQTPRITIIAKSAIPEGEELVVSYVDPSQDVWTRRRMLKEWGFGTCLCARCVQEAESSKAAGGGVEQKAELEDELRGFLGV